MEDIFKSFFYEGVLMTTTIFLAAIFGIFVGAIGSALVGVVLLGKDLFSISERLNSLYSQNLNVLSNINNPAVSGLVNTIAQQEHSNGINKGIDFVFMALYKLYDDGEFLDFDSLSDGIHKALAKMNSDQNVFDDIRKKFDEYNELREDEDDDD